MSQISNHIDEPLKAYCIFCGSTVGQTSESTDEKVNAVFDCPKCQANYCDQCSYEEEINNSIIPVCLRCDSQMEQVLPEK